ncbi:hypothetical protein H2203_001048 [Taxawa tesnikishii (nom. ined.)]|nr:hypothetical protein H2203_001048 [Dothideales sp. JES 119]
MYRRSDPRFRRTLNEISQTIESANESAQENIFTFSHRYLTPCFSSRTRRRGRSYGRAELNFDFYDDWDDDENDALLGWGNDGFDRLLAGSGNTNTQPGRQRGMSYGTRRDKSGRRKSAVQPHDGGADPTIIPSTSYFGFLGKLTGKVGGKKGLRYKPSAADLQEHPGAFAELKGDIFPSEDELDDAVPLDDEFAMVLERRTTGSGLNDESSSGRGKRGKRPNAGSRMSTRTMSSRSTRTSHRASRATSGSPTPERIIDGDANTVPSLTELKQEEERAQQEEEADIARRREAAKRLALERGLSTSDHPAPTTTNNKAGDVVQYQETEPTSPDESKSVSSPSPHRPSSETVPFPAFDPPPDEQFSPLEDPIPARMNSKDVEDFVPAQLPHFPGRDER